MSLFSLLQDCFEALSHGSFPPSDLLKQTISKVRRLMRCRAYKFPWVIELSDCHTIQEVVKI